jgi:hypothetical protein
VGLAAVNEKFAARPFRDNLFMAKVSSAEQIESPRYATLHRYFYSAAYSKCARSWVNDDFQVVGNRCRFFFGQHRSLQAENKRKDEQQVVV